MLVTNKINSIKDSNELIEKFVKLKIKKLFKSGNLKSEKLSMSQKLAKLGKNLSKSENLSQFNAKKARSSLLIANARTAFYYL